MRNIILTFLMLLCTYSNLSAQVYEDDVKVVEQNYDNENTDDEKKANGTFGKEVLGDTLINFSDYNLPIDSVRAWKNSNNYKWLKEIENELKSKNKTNSKVTQEAVENTRKISNTISTSQSILNSGALKLILWILAIIFVCFIIYQLFLNKGFFTKNTTQNAVTEVADEQLEYNMDNDFAALQRKAYDQHDYRLAMRYMFLGMLQKLNQRNHIKYIQDKTNSDYANEMPEGVRENFSTLALYFEYVWYGKFEINQQQFNQIETQYKQFLSKI
jgi:hypothetical protein